MKPTVTSFLIFLLYHLALLCSCVGIEGQAHALPNTESQNNGLYMTFPSDTQISYDSERGTVRFLKSSNLTQELEQSKAFTNLQATNQYHAIVLQFFDAYRAPFTLTNPSKELVVHSTQSDDLGFTQIRLKQMVEDIPIWGAEVLVQLDRSNHINLVQGHYYPSPKGVRLHPQLPVEAIRELTASYLGLPDSDCQACGTSLLIFMTNEKVPRLAYSVHTPLNRVKGWNLIVDAETGEILQQLSTVFSQ